jgi:hypothetical protein
MNMGEKTAMNKPLGEEDVRRMITWKGENTRTRTP